MFNNSQVEAKALRFPSLKIAGKSLTPVVVKTMQGLSPTGSDDESKVVPVGPRTLENGNSGGWFAGLNLPWVSKKKEPEEDSKRSPLRIFHLVDVSSSMRSTLRETEGNLTKLEYVKQSVEELIKRIPKDIKAGIEHVLIPYGEHVTQVRSFFANEEKDFFEAIRALGISYGTNIFKPIDEVINYIKESKNKDVRNLAILFSDGEHIPRIKDAETEVKAKERFSDLEAVNSALFNVGVGTTYKRSFMQDSLANAKFGGLAHIPNSKGDVNLYEAILPRFIQDLSSAPQYPVINFNQYFDQVINMNPTARKVSRTDGQFEAVVGYQTEAFNVGFVEEDKLEQAGVSKTVKDKANSESIKENEDLIIRDIDEVPLDPSEREQYKEYLLIALKNLLLESDNPLGQLEEFIEENNFEDDILQYLKEELEAILMKFDDELMDVQDERSFVASNSVSINRTFMRGIPVEAEVQGDGDTLMPEASHTIVGRGSLKQILVNDLGSIIEMPNGNLTELHLSFTNIAEDNQIIDQITIKEGEPLVIGRAKEAHLRLEDQNISRRHAEIQIKNGKVYIRDQNSRNGTKLNGQLLPAGESVRLMPTDIISICDQSFRVDF